MDIDAVREPLADPEFLTEIARFAGVLRDAAVGITETDILARITALEELKAAVGSVQAEEAVAFAELRRERDRVNQVPEPSCGLRSGEEIGLAKKVSPGAGRKFLTTSRAIVGEMPNTFKALSRGTISEDKARIMVEETAVLQSADRRRVDTRMRNSMGPAGLRSLRMETRALSEEMDAQTVAERARKAASNRRVTVTAIDNGMGRVSAILPLPQAVAVFGSLKDAADSIFADGAADGRGRQQLLADTFVERLTGQETASAVPAMINLVVEAESLLSDGLVPAWLPGFGPLPAKTARNFVSANEARMLIRRLFTRGEDGQLVGMEARSRSFTGGLRDMLIFRDDVCRTPWCDAPIKHADHADPYASGGQTSWENGSGLCAACNYAKEQPGWKHEATADGLNVTTPSGSEYEVTTPALVKRMRYPRAEEAPGSESRHDDWRLKFSRFLEPDRPARGGSPPDSDGSPSESDDTARLREIELSYFPITQAEAKKSAAKQPVTTDLVETDAVTTDDVAESAEFTSISERPRLLQNLPPRLRRHRPQSRSPARSLTRGSQARADTRRTISSIDPGHESVVEKLMREASA